jgi:hypothetical protein
VNVITLPRLDITRLAADFSQSVRESLTAGQLLNVRAGRAVPDDYVDSGELLAEAVYLQAPHAESIADFADELVTASERAADSGYRLSRILIACEFSGTVRDAFAARGHSVMSCDVLPTEAPGAHYQGDVRDILTDGWHMAVMHPPCTYLAACQLWRCLPQHAAKHPGRAEKKAEALEFIRDLMTAPIDKWAIENPKGAIGTEIRPADDKLQPYEFGHDHAKETHLWLKNLKPLVRDPALFIPGRDAVNNSGNPVKRWANQCDGSGADRTGPSVDRGHKRSRFFTGIAEAMAEQWGGIQQVLKAPANAEPLGQLALF